MGMAAKPLAIVMSSSFLNPSLAFSSHFDPDGTPLSELSWSSSLAVVALSFSGLFTFIFLMLACLCCKKGDIGFKEFENAEGEDYVTELSVQSSPAAQNGPEVYILPLTEVSLPMAKQPGRSVQLLKATDLGRHSLLYLKEIGHGWFGKVFLGEVNVGLSSTQVVVKELKVSASVQDQMQFLEEAQPYRALQHTNLLQCLAQCAEVTPYLLVMEFCPLGDLKGYLRSCQVADSMAPDPLTLQRMACEVACGTLHLHRNHYVHSDLALRNCLLTADLTVKIGDYGLSHCKYKEDYLVTADQLWVPLRWLAPELLDEVHGNLLVVDQTKPSNVWSLGVTIWELFELGDQPYRRYSDRQVLTYAIKEQQLKLPKPHLKLLLAERWYEVMQFCWLLPEQRPTAEEVHLLLSYLCAKGATEAEEEFQRRWNAMKPNSSSGSSQHGAEVSSFPLLEQFSSDGFHSDGDDVLTVMETSRGLNFEYKWEPSKAERFQGPAGGLSPDGAGRSQDLYYPAGSVGRLSLGVSPSCYQCKQQGCSSLPGPGVVPVLGARSPSLGSEYYIRIEEPLEGSAKLDLAMCSYSPDAEQGSPATAFRWPAGRGDSRDAYDSDSSPAVSLTMEPLLGQAPPHEGSWEHPDYYPYHCHGQDPPYCQPSPGDGTDHYLLDEPLEAGSTECRVPGFQKNIFEDPLGISPSVNCAYGPPGYAEPHPAPLAGRLLECVGQRVASRTQSSGPDCVTLELGEESPCSSPRCRGGERGGEPFPEEAGAVVPMQHWTSNSSSNNNVSSCPPPPCEPPANDSWCYRHMITFRGLMAEPLGSVPRDKAELRDILLERRSLMAKDFQLGLQDQPLSKDQSFHLDPGQCKTLPSTENSSSSSSSSFSSPQGLGDWESGNLPAFDHLEDAALAGVPGARRASSAELPPDSWSGAAAQQCLDEANMAPRQSERGEGNPHAQMPQPRVMEPAGPVDMGHAEAGVACQPSESTPVPTKEAALPLDLEEWAGSCAHTEGNPCADCTQLPSEASEAAGQVPGDIAVDSGKSVTSDLDRTPDKTFSSTSFPDMDDSDEDTAELTSGVFTDFSGDYVERVDVTPSFKSLQKQVGTPDSLESLDIPSTASSCEIFSPSTYVPSNQPKALDSGYDTENYESPEFVLKEPHDSREPEAFIHLGKSPVGLEGGEGDGVVSEMHLSSSFSAELHGLSEKNPHRDSAYFSDYDTEAERYLKEDEDSDGSEAQDREAGCSQLDAPVLGRALSLNSDGGEPPQLDDTPNSPQGAACTTGAGTSGAAFPVAGEVLSSGEGSAPAARSPQEPDAVVGAEARTAGHRPDLDSSRDTTWSECPAVPGIPAGSVPSKPFLLSPVVASPEGPAQLGLAETGGEEPVQDGLSGPLREAAAPSSESDEPEMRLGPEGEAQACSGRAPAQEPSPAAGPQPSLDPSLRRARAELQPPGPEDEEDTEDSDESDEELRCYSIQEQSEESEDEPVTVPIVVAESHSARNLRSLLKMPSLLSQAFCEDLERKKKAVSFYDDVTVYLFDQVSFNVQESPTRELGDQMFPEVTEPSPQPVQNSSTGPPSPAAGASASDDPLDGHASEESSGFEWDDDFPLLPVKTSFLSSLTVVPVPSLPSLDPGQKQGLPLQFSRFTVSPAPLSRFSISHVSDSAVEAVGGSNEDGASE